MAKLRNFRDDMQAGLGIINARQIALRYDAPLIVFNRHHPQIVGASDYHTLLCVPDAWSATGFPDSWIPAAARTRMMRDLSTWRAQRTA